MGLPHLGLADIGNVFGNMFIEGYRKSPIFGWGFDRAADVKPNSVLFNIPLVRSLPVCGISSRAERASVFRRVGQFTPLEGAEIVRKFLRWLKGTNNDNASERGSLKAGGDHRSVVVARAYRARKGVTAHVDRICRFGHVKAGSQMCR